MATLATFFKRADAIGVNAERHTAVRAQNDPYQLRALPNDDIYFYTKRIDNSRVIRQADPTSRGQCWSAISATVAVAVLLSGSIIAPKLGTVLAGYELEKLKVERQTLLDQRRALDVQEAALLSPAHLNDLAKVRSLSLPANGQIVHLDAKATDTHYAQNHQKNNSQGIQ